MAARSIKDRTRSSVVEGERVIDLRDHGGPMRTGSRWRGQKPNRTGPRRIEPSDLERSGQLRETKFFGSPAFRRLWLSQVLSSLGDWIGFVAVAAIANRIAGASGLSLVLAVRLGLAFVFAPFAGVMIDRVSRKRIMVMTDIGRCLVLCALPFINHLWGLILVSVALELMTLLWSPAKEASVPNLVKPEFLPTANSLSLAAAYGTFPVAAALFAVLAKVPDWLGQGEHLKALRLTPDSVALYFDALTYLASAAVIATLALAHTPREVRKGEADVSSFREAIDGLQFVRTNPKVRAVVFGLAAGLVGGGSIVPLGVIFATDVLHAGSGGYGLLLTAMGIGVGVGMIGISFVQKRIPKEQAFVFVIFACGGALALAASMNGLGAAAFCIGALGVAAGCVYVLGFTILQTNVDDEIRGRVFATFYTLTRVCLLLAVTLSPFVSRLLDTISGHLFHGKVSALGMHIALPGVRLTLWLSAVIIIGAGVLAVHSLRRPTPTTARAVVATES